MTHDTDVFTSRTFTTHYARNNWKTFTIPLREHVVDPEFSRFEMLSKRYRTFKELRRELITALEELVNRSTGTVRRGNMTEETAVSYIHTYSIPTLVILLREYNRENGPEELMELLDTVVVNAHRNSEPLIRNIATYRKYLSGMHGHMAEAILDKIRVKASPLFAYADLSQLKGEERSKFESVLSFYRLGYDALVPQNIKDYTDRGEVSRMRRVDAIQEIPSVGPEAAAFLLENNDHERIIKYVKRHRPEALDVSKLKAYLGRSAAISNGLTVVRKALTR